MPVTWEVVHPQRLVMVRTQGVLRLKDLEQYFDAMITNDLMLYDRLFDATDCEPDFSDHDILMLGARMSAYAVLGKRGPLAFVASRDAVRHVIARYLNLSDNSVRPAAVFDSLREARAWLEQQRGISF